MNPKTRRTDQEDLQVLLLGQATSIDPPRQVIQKKDRISTSLTYCQQYVPKKKVFFGTNVTKKIAKILRLAPWLIQKTRPFEACRKTDTCHWKCPLNECNKSASENPAEFLVTSFKRREMFELRGTFIISGTSWFIGKKGKKKQS